MGGSENGVVSPHARSQRKPAGAVRMMAGKMVGRAGKAVLEDTAVQTLREAEAG